MRHLIAIVAFATVPAAQAQVTRAERSAYRETSAYDDVRAFLDSLARSGAPVRVLKLGTTTEGRSLPLVVASRPLVADAGEARRSGKPVVYLQANIHAGEIEGKEATLMLLRDLSHGSLRPLLDSVVLLAVPIYNADGNERWGSGDAQRPGQNGPARVGRRANGQGLDLNRDYVKMEAPETRAAVELLKAWDPDLIIDLHTTNGSYHGYQLTFSPGLNPNSGPIGEYARDSFLPEVRTRMQTRHRRPTFWYGNFRNQEPDSLVLGWETYDARPRFGTNAETMRGRLAILSEAYSNDDFRTRTAATYDFVLEILRLAAERRAEIFDARRAFDAWRPDSIAVRSVLADPSRQDVIAELTESVGKGSDGYAPRRRTGNYRTIAMPVYDRFTAARREAVPAAYLFPPDLAAVAALLSEHGVHVERLAANWRGSVETFAVDSIVAAPAPFEGHRTVLVEGRWRTAAARSVPRGWFVVRTAQRLGVWSAYMLEPASEDGVGVWNLLDRLLRAGAEHPVLRTRDLRGALTEAALSEWRVR